MERTINGLYSVSLSLSSVSLFLLLTKAHKSKEAEKEGDVRKEDSSEISFIDDDDAAAY